MARKGSPITNSQVLINGGATSPTVEVCQRESGRCRLYWYTYDQDGSTSETLATYRETDWGKAVKIAKGLLPILLP